LADRGSVPTSDACTSGGSRQHPTGPAPGRPPTATQTATHLLPDDTDLAAVVAAWPRLPEALRAGIVALVRAAQA
jgi:hypothetical protein